MTTSSASNVIVLVRRSMLESNGREKHVMHQRCEIHQVGKKNEEMKHTLHYVQRCMYNG